MGFIITGYLMSNSILLRQYKTTVVRQCKKPCIKRVHKKFDSVLRPLPYVHF